MTNNIIEVNGIKTYSYHGCLDEERREGTNYEVDVIMHTDFSLAASTDDLSKTIDYVNVYKIVIEEMNIPSKLIETVGKRIINHLKNDLNNLLNVKLIIRKYNPPIGGEVNYVSIAIEENLV